MAETRVMREQKVLRCYLTNAEKLERGQRVAELTYTIDGLEAEKKAEADRYKGKISEAEGLRKQLSGVLRDGYEMRPVECRIEMHYDLGRVWTIREDTGELIDDREMKEEERFRQGRLFPPAEEPPRSPESIGREALERGGPTILPAEESIETKDTEKGAPDDAAEDAERIEEPTTETTSDDDPANADGATAAGEEERQEKRSGDAHCVTCHHAEHVHGDALQGRSSACMAIGCTCKRFVAADPLGVDDYDPAAEKGAAPCDSAS